MSAVLIGVVLVGLGAAWLLSTQNDDFIFDLEIGQCFDEPAAWSEGGGSEVEGVDVVDCAEPHDAEVVGAGALNPDGSAEYPSDEELFAVIDAACSQVEGVPLDRFGLIPVAPTAATWSALDGRYLCVALPYGGEPTAGSIVDG